MKKVISAVLVFALLLGIMPCMGQRAAVAAEGEGSGISTYRYGDFGYEVGTYSDNSKYIDIKCYYGNDSHIIIPDEIDGISVDYVSGLTCSEEVAEKVKEITLGVNVRKITAFDSLPELEAIHCSGENAYLEDKDGVLYGKNFFGIVRILCYPRKRKGSSYTIPEYVKEIDSAFEKVEYLRTVNVGKWTKKIKDFGKWSKIEQVNFSDQSILKKVNKRAFQYMVKLRQINIPKGVTHIEEGAFQYCRELTDIQLPSTVEKIGDDAFLSCSSLKKIKIPKRVYYISGSAFLQCKAKLQKASYLKKSKEEKQKQGYCYRIFVKATYKKKTKSYLLNDVLEIKNEKKTIHLKKGKKTKIKVRVKLGKKWMTLKTPVAEFKSSNNKIATVNADGTVKAKKKGTVKITTMLYHEGRNFPYEEVLEYTTKIKVR